MLASRPRYLRSHPMNIVDIVCHDGLVRGTIHRKTDYLESR